MSTRAQIVAELARRIVERASGTEGHRSHRNHRKREIHAGDRAA
jgi:hypothetical protein